MLKAHPGHEVFQVIAFRKLFKNALFLKFCPLREKIESSCTLRRGMFAFYETGHRSVAVRFFYLRCGRKCSAAKRYCRQLPSVS